MVYVENTVQRNILYLKKNFDSVVTDRLSNYNAHEFTDIKNCIDLINKHSQNYFYTIKTDIKPILFYDSLFKGNFIKNYFIKIDPLFQKFFCIFK